MTTPLGRLERVDVRKVWLGEAGSVLKDLSDFIKAQDPAHVAAMVRVVEPPAEEAGDV